MSNSFRRVVGQGVASIARILMVLVIGGLVTRRFLRTQMSRERARQIVALDLEQAQQLQQRVLVPEVLHSPAFSVETGHRVRFRIARRVGIGGDDSYS